MSQEFIKRLKKTAGTILAIKGAFEKFFLEYQNPEYTAQRHRYFTQLAPSLAHEVQSVYNRLRHYKHGVQQFSDTFILYAPIVNDSGDNLVDPLWAILTAAAMIMPYSLNGKCALRGAIHIGKGVELSKDNFYGPALAMAHHLESKKADYPRIIVSDEVVSYLNTNEPLSNDQHVNSISRNLLQMCAKMVVRDYDGQYIIDFAGKAVYEMTKGSAGKYMKEALRFANTEKDRFHNECNKKHHLRYSKLVNYIDTNIHLWM